MVDSSPTNALELSVSELSGALKRAIEDQFGHVRLRGEISNYRGPHSSGHAYFCLKDANARIDAVVWKGTFLRLKTKPQEGLEVIATGRITTFPGKSSYQIVIEALEPAGVGALMALLEARRKKLAAEGLFDEARKKALPFLPGVIGIVTSPTGAVIRDILHRLSDRFPRRVLVWPVRVQGETSAAEVAAGIAGFNALPPGGAIPRPDLLIVARGGGSLEDLWSFNEEEVLRAAAASEIPLISAIGHETDWTLLDHVADLRAPTPTGAAEKAVPVRAELLAAVNALARRHNESILRLIERRRNDLRALARAMPQAEALLATPRQRQDRAAERLAAALRGFIGTRRLALSEASRLLARHAPQAELQRVSGRLNTLKYRFEAAGRTLRERRRERLETLRTRFAAAFSARLLFLRQDVSRSRERFASLSARLDGTYSHALSRRRDRLGHAAQLLGAVGYEAVLRRGFALARDAEDGIVRSARQLGPGDALRLYFSDGKVEATVTGEEPAKKRAPAAKKPQAARQGSLF
ncbi:Exodeoxyribonuclease VII large subunit [Rhodoblastus acidophilus]|uniref:Exodeoxyribonuclease 7 large subunit n=1 Tax=Rhodoblastus acidophilus TaxID=1074 RepID=A0A212QZL5_RHOAC|nr:exodeoxyribonuclease VII large subunit [Rhodoblastus acidophilus]PPQ40523.1 exodeoxyribonuclease VII large subunit [Rhodoblastus acidophilus]RAI18641.1 exodeoxyribonuclease VII large subunit [Rhodoblastus acidophilus]SNB65182.1 Exodeoxyribonuclease VII large subunit [Rhodoblastus acidophilus]